MLKTSSSRGSPTSATQIAVKYDGVDGGGGESVEKSSKRQRVVKKSEESPRPEKSAKAICSVEPSFLTSDTRLAVTKMGLSQNLVQNLQSKTTSHCCSLQELKALPASRRPTIIASDGSEIQKTQAPVRGAKKIFQPKTLESFTSGNQQSLCTKNFVYKTHVLPPLKFWRCTSKEDVPAQDQGGDT